MSATITTNLRFLAPVIAQPVDLGLSEVSPLAEETTEVAFPVNQSIALDSLGLSTRARQLVAGFAKAKGGSLSTVQAFRVIKQLEFGKNIFSDHGREAFDTISRRFFPGFTNFKERAGRVAVTVAQVADGDTSKTQGINVRHSGGNTPESNSSSKLRNEVEGMVMYIKVKFGLDDSMTAALMDIIQAREVYLGKLAGIVNQRFVDYFENISLGASYARVASAEHLCGVLDYADKYGRMIGRFFAGKPFETDDLFHKGFIDAELVNAMEADGMSYYKDLQRKLKLHEGFLNSIKTTQRDLHAFLTGTYLRPTEMFSRENCRKINKNWQAFVAENPEAKNDLMCLMIFMGVASTYPKYRDERTALYLKAEQHALGHAYGAQEKMGMAADPIFIFLRPNANPNDPDASPVYTMFTEKMSGGKDLNPPDCCDTFGCGIG